LIYVGIDPGKVGYITALNEDGSTVGWPMPINSRGDVSGDGIFNILNEVEISAGGINNVRVVIEEVHAIFGSAAGSTFSFGFNVGKLHGVLDAFGVEFELVQPKAWQKIMWASYSKELKKSSSGKTNVTDTKATSIKVAKDLFPDVDLRRTKRSKKPDDNKADSLLLAEYLRRKYEK